MLFRSKSQTPQRHYLSKDREANRLTHLAIVMDGNGRWAKQRGESRTHGHSQGAKTVRNITQYCAKNAEIQTLTLYAFSTENWNRPKAEVSFLMTLLGKYLKNESQTYMENNIKFETIGDLSRFSKGLQKTIANLKDITKDNSRLTQILALNYGGRDEIVRAAKRVISKDMELTEDSIGSELDTSYSDIDLMIRTSNEKRISNFLLWQASYSELYFTPTLWPDFCEDELDKIISDYKNRDRRFGA